MTQPHHSTGDTSGPSWTSPAGHYMGQSQPWQGQSGPYYDPAQHYYDPHNPAAWHQSAQYPGGRPPKKPVYKQWWFITILTVVMIGLIAIAIALTTGEKLDNDVAQPQGPDAPAAPLLPEDSTGNGESRRVQRSDDGRFVLEDGGTKEQALAEAQERIDAGYSHYGPTDLMDVLRYDGYQNQAIEYALNNLNIDWDKQALGVGQRMGDSDYGGYSAQEIRQHLVRAGFIDDEVQYAMDNLDIDFNEQAVAALESYRDIFDDRTEDEIREYLHQAGFQGSEIDYAFDNMD